MKRRIGVCLSAAALLLAACSQAPDRADERAAGTDGWVQAVVIERATRRARSLTVSGQAAPGARVVLRGAQEQAFAVSADERGHFELRIPTPTSAQLYRAEVQAGQEVASGAAQLLVTESADGVLALVSPGDPSRRLDARRLIGSVDHDGRVMLVSGVAPAGSQVEVALDGRPGPTVTAGPDGRWTANLGATGQGAVRLSVRQGARTLEVAYPGAGSPGPDPLTVGDASGGLRAAWRTPDGAAQTAWFPRSG